MFSLFFLSLMKNYFLLRNKLNFKNIKFEKTNEKLIILGNGPSLNNDIKKILSIKEDFDFFVVNNFCSSEYYTLIKPKTYFFCDPLFYLSKVSEVNEIKRNNIFDKINKNTDWKVTIYLPKEADLDFLKVKIYNNNINLKKIYYKPSEYFLKDNFFVDFFLSTGVFVYPIVNVLVLAIYFGLCVNYKTIEIYGADASFHKNIEVDSENNLYIINKHFNEKNSKELIYLDVLEKDKCSMSEFLYLNSMHFKIHEKLNLLSKSKKIKIINKSSFSLIDSYERGFE